MCGSGWTCRSSIDGVWNIGNNIEHLEKEHKDHIPLREERCMNVLCFRALSHLVPSQGTPCPSLRKQSNHYITAAGRTDRPRVRGPSRPRSPSQRGRRSWLTHGEWSGGGFLSPSSPHLDGPSVSQRWRVKKPGNRLHKTGKGEKPGNGLFVRPVERASGIYGT